MNARGAGMVWSRRVFSQAGLLALILGGVFLTLTVGQSITSPTTLWAVFIGQETEDAFPVLSLRLPRAVLAVLAGAAFGLGGAAFQTLLRNPLASPDIIGISAGAGAAAVFCIVVLSMSGPVVSVVAIGAGLAVALLIYVLAWRGGVSGTRLILVGIGISAMLQSLTAHLLSRAPSWSLQEAMRWLAGSLNGAQLDQALPLLAVLAACGGALVWHAPALEVMRIGDDVAGGLGIHLGRVRVSTIVAGVGLVATATAVAGPIAFVAFLSGPIATRLVGRGGSVLGTAALIGAVLVLICDFAGQVLLPARYPVGVVTGLLGAPYLVLLVIRENTKGGGA